MRRRMRKQITGVFNPWNFALEAGQRVINTYNHHVYDLYESSGVNKSRSGELSCRRVKPPTKYAVPVYIDGVWYWDNIHET